MCHLQREGENPRGLIGFVRSSIFQREGTVMKAKCPYCGYEEDVADDTYGSMVECPCGQSFVVGQVQVLETAFVGDAAIVKCPYCESENNLPKEAIGRDVRCGKCNCKFSIAVKKEKTSNGSSDTRVGNCKISIRPRSSAGQRKFEQGGLGQNLRTNQSLTVAHSASESLVSQRNHSTTKTACEDVNLDLARAVTLILNVVNVLACIVWAVYAFGVSLRYKRELDIWDIAVDFGLPLLTAASVYVSLALIAAVLEIAKNIRQVCNEVSQLRQERR